MLVCSRPARGGAFRRHSVGGGTAEARLFPRGRSGAAAVVRGSEGRKARRSEGLMRCLDPPGHWRSSRVLASPSPARSQACRPALARLRPSSPRGNLVQERSARQALNARSRAEARSQGSRASRAGRPGLQARGSLALPCLLALALLDPEPARPGRPAPPLSCRGGAKSPPAKPPGHQAAGPKAFGRGRHRTPESSAMRAS